MLSKFTKCYNKFVINGLGVIEKRSYNGLDTKDTVIVKARAIRRIGGVLDFGAVLDQNMLGRRMLGFLWIGVIQFAATVSNVIIHYEAASMFDVVPSKVNACI